jgi:transcriptional regulator with XRE-family HTH domain
MTSNYIEDLSGTWPELKDVPMPQHDKARPVTMLLVAWALATSMGGLVQHVNPKILADYQPLPIIGSQHGSARRNTRTTAQCLAQIREVFKPSVTELATLFGVARQTVYNWQAGQPIAPENAARLEDIAAAADVLQEEGLAGQSYALRRPLPGGGTLFDRVRQGDSAAQAVLALVEMLHHESAQREGFKARVTDQERQPVDTDELGLPFLNEQV